jgi:DNA polymerase III subunit epsilon
MPSSTLLSQGAFVAVDIETTGCLPGRNGIIELGAARIEAGRVVATFGELAAPGEAIPYAVQLLTGITDRMVADAPPIEDVFERFRLFAEGAVLIAHNYRFDLGFLDFLAEVSHGEPFPRPVLDTLALAKRLHPALGKYNLALMAETYGAKTAPNHRADADALATAEVFLGMLPRLLEEGVTTAGEAARFCKMGGQESLARKLVMTTSLPDHPGIYLLRDKTGAVIYVGRAKNLRVRLRSYFYVNSDASGPRLGDETVSIQHLQCWSNLDAMLLQSRLVGRYAPKHNMSNERGETATLIHIDTGSRFPALKITTKPRKSGKAIGPFVNRWAVESLVDQLREVYGLRRCDARITEGAEEVACEYRENATCPSPCMGRIGSDEYRERVNEALGVFDKSAEELRAQLERRHEAAVEKKRFDQAVRYRDAIRALDRAMGGLDTVKRAAAQFGVIIVESEEERVTVHLIRHGYLVKTIRMTREECSTDGWAERLARALHRAYYTPPYVDNPMEFSHQQLKDVFLVANYRQQSSPREIEVTADEPATLQAMLSVLRRQMRVTRRRHVLTSADRG